MSDAQAAQAKAYGAAVADPTISASAMGRVCRATIAALIVRSPSIIKVTKIDGSIVHTRYTRGDGTVWKNQCWDRAETVIHSLRPPGRFRGRRLSGPTFSTGCRLA